jgi:phospholipase/carboxylesterase
VHYISLTRQPINRREKPMPLTCVEIEPATTATASVLWLHGLGADGHDFEPIVPELRLPRDSAVRFVFPNAPSIPVTINGGMVMPAWYDILAMDVGREIDERQLLQSAAAVSMLVDREIERGIDSHRIVIAGFSQGGAVAYQLALSYPRPLAGLLVLSAYFPTARSIALHPANRSLPIQVCHGSLDPVVPEELGHQAHQTLLAMGYAAGYRTYPIGHSVCPQEIGDISRWLQETVRR